MGINNRVMKDSAQGSDSLIKIVIFGNSVSLGYSGPSTHTQNGPVSFADEKPETKVVGEEI